MLNVSDTQAPAQAGNALAATPAEMSPCKLVGQAQEICGVILARELLKELRLLRAELASSRASEPSIGLASSKAMHPADKDGPMERPDMTRITAAQEAQARHLFRIASALERVVFDGLPLRNQ